MALKIRLWRQGCKNKASYRVVVANTQSPRDGKYVEAIGWYNREGKTDEQKRSIHADRLLHWISLGAQMSQTVMAIAKQAVPEAMKEYTKKVEARVAKRRARA
jgi:small subunit ribosomal protein S16